MKKKGGVMRIEDISGSTRGMMDVLRVAAEYKPDGHPFRREVVFDVPTGDGTTYDKTLPSGCVSYGAVERDKVQRVLDWAMEEMAAGVHTLVEDLLCQFGEAAVVRALDVLLAEGWADRNLP